MEVEPKAPTTKGPADWFTGDVYLDMVHNAKAPSRLTVGNVRFTPGARTNWHSHPLGQTLLVTDGVGLVATRDGKVVPIRPGDSVWTPPGEEHWHGATSDNLMCHLALTESPDENGPANWLEPVSDEEYERACVRAFTD